MPRHQSFESPLLMLQKNMMHTPFGLSLSKPAHASVPALGQAQGERVCIVMNFENINTSAFIPAFSAMTARASVTH
jgi:hypothetical protein